MELESWPRSKKQTEKKIFSRLPCFPTLKQTSRYSHAWVGNNKLEQKYTWQRWKAPPITSDSHLHVGGERGEGGVWGVRGLHMSHFNKRPYINSSPRLFSRLQLLPYLYWKHQVTYLQRDSQLLCLLFLLELESCREISAIFFEVEKVKVNASLYLIPCCCRWLSKIIIKVWPLIFES